MALLFAALLVATAIDLIVLLMEYVAAALLGFAGGTLGGLVGVGGGILFVPALVIFLDQSQVRAEATSLLAIVFVAMLGAWRQHGYGNVRVRDGLDPRRRCRRSAWPRGRDLERRLGAHPRAVLRRPRPGDRRPARPGGREADVRRAWR